MSKPFITITCSSASGRPSLGSMMNAPYMPRAMCSASGVDVAVVEVQAERLGVELVRDRLAGLDDAEADAGEPVHAGRVDAVEVDRVRVRGAVAEADAQPLALTGAQRGRRDAAVVRPGRELHAGGDLDLPVVGDQLPLAQHARRSPAAACGRGRSRAAARSGGSRLPRGRPSRRPGSRDGPGTLPWLVGSGALAGGRLVLVGILRARRRRDAHAAELGHRPAPSAGARAASILLRLRRCMPQDYGMPKSKVGYGQMSIEARVTPSCPRTAGPRGSAPPSPWTPPGMRSRPRTRSPARPPGR